MQTGEDLFFFSSRRRHTRWTGDWSSDVCSSDLRLQRPVHVGRAGRRRVREGAAAEMNKTIEDFIGDTPRSEERRVGKECGSRWWGYQQSDRGRQMVEACRYNYLAPTAWTWSL